MRVTRCGVWMVGAGLGLLLTAAQVVAHHSFAAEFDASLPMEMRGTITKIEWINPHGWIHITVKRQDGQTENWEVEVGPPNSLFRRGWTKNSVPAGTEVVIFGYRSKDPKALKLNGQQVLLPDGRKLFVGSPGTGAPEDKKP